VRFATGAILGPADALQPASRALDIDLELKLQQGDATCFDDAGLGAAQADVTYHCLVTLPTGQSRWSGRLGVVLRGGSLTHDARGFRVCRYTSDNDGRPGISNAEHPLDYREVDAPLVHQNFLVIRGDNACPAGRGSPEAADASTLEQAPQPEASPSA
jgi:hypothetical protein